MRDALCILLLAGGIATGCGAESGGGSTSRIVLEPTATREVTNEELDRSVEVMQARVEKLGLDGGKVRRDGRRIVVEIGRDRSPAAVRILLRPGRLEFFDLQGDLTGPSIDDQGFPVPSKSPLRSGEKTVVITCGKEERYCPGVDGEPNRNYFYLFEYDPKAGVPEMTGADLELAAIRQDFEPVHQSPNVLMEFTKAGAEKFSRLTRRLAKRGRALHDQIGGEPENTFQQFAIVLDQELRTAPTIDFNENPLGVPGAGGAQITGLGSVEEARELALVLQTGALPVEFRVVSE